PLVILRPNPKGISIIDEEPVEATAHADAPVQPEAVHISGVWLKQHIGVPIAHLFMTLVNGDSMAPALSHNDVVIVDRNALQAGFRDGVWVFRLGDAIHVKRVQQTGPAQYQATCDNPSYSPIALTEDFHLIGRVVWSFKSW
ncbi:MAG: S24 family peptidase, partial [Holophagaceae bacterium]|nr:S24 family peptidase [Holophagaceae bacterium]